MVTKEFAVEIDTKLSALYDERFNLLYKLATAKETKEFYEKHYPTRIEEIEKNQSKIDSIKGELVKINVKIIDLNVIYNQDPWTRAFLVLASNGHVHSSMDCNTCFPTTRYNWLVQYSNDEESTIVEDAGQDACTICYPSAPAEVLNRPSRIVTADKVAKAEAKAEREAKKAARIAKDKANAPTASGEFLTYKEGKWTREIKTERSAITEWYSQYSDSQRTVVTQYFNNEPHSEESIQHQKERIAFAGEIAQLICFNLAEKHGITYDEQEAILIKKYEKRGY
jgi:hypothetical protein